MEVRLLALLQGVVANGHLSQGDCWNSASATSLCNLTGILFPHMQNGDNDIKMFVRIKQHT